MRKEEAKYPMQSEPSERGVTKVNPRLYLGATAKVWQAANGEWRYRTFGRCRQTVEGRTSKLSLALADVRRFA